MTMPATHSSTFYDGARQYTAETGGFLREGLERGHRGLVMAPPRRVDQLRAALGRDADEVTFVEDTIAYAPQWNVYRVLLDFAAKAPGVRSCVVAEQTLTARTPAELVDYRRLEAAMNVVFAEADVDLLCPYDAGSLPAHLLEIGMHTHGDVRAGGALAPNARFDDPFDMLAGLATVVPPPADATTFHCLSPGRRRHRAPAGTRPWRRGRDRSLPGRRPGAGGHRGADERAAPRRAACAPPRLRGGGHLGLPRDRQWTRTRRPARGPAPARRAVGPRLRTVAGPPALRGCGRRHRPDRHPRTAPHAAHWAPSSRVRR